MSAAEVGSERVGGGGAEATFARKRAFLESGAAWPEQPQPLAIETHASLVLLTRDRAWKMKKPVLLGHIDLRSLQARAHFCREEVRLNRELAGDVYRGLTPVIEKADGSLALEGDGRVVDWLVEMLRLPEAAMLDNRLRAGPAPRLEEMEAVADILIAFYGARARNADAGQVCAERLMQEARLNADHLREMRTELGAPLREEVLDAGIAWLEDCRPEIVARGEQGLIIEGHGDLRAEHVCLTVPPVVFDRVEFDHSMRLVDPYFEFNALGLECGLAGAGQVRPLLLSRLEAAGLPPPSSDLLALYGVSRYLARARLAIDHLRDADVRTPRKWPAQARLYLDTAAQIHDGTGPGARTG